MQWSSIQKMSRSLASFSAKNPFLFLRKMTLKQNGLADHSFCQKAMMLLERCSRRIFFALKRKEKRSFSANVSQNEKRRRKKNQRRFQQDQHFMVWLLKEIPSSLSSIALGRWNENQAGSFRKVLNRQDSARSMLRNGSLKQLCRGWRLGRDLTWFSSILTSKPLSQAWLSLMIRRGKKHSHS